MYNPFKQLTNKFRKKGLRIPLPDGTTFETIEVDEDKIDRTIGLYHNGTWYPPGYTENFTTPEGGLYKFTLHGADPNNNPIISIERLDQP